MKKKIGIILSIALILIVGFSGMRLVSAGLEGNPGTTISGGVNTCSTDICAGNVLYGIRFSLVGPDGTQVGNQIIDFWPDRIWTDGGDITKTVTDYYVRDGNSVSPSNRQTSVAYGTSIRQNVVKDVKESTIADLNLNRGEYWNLPHVKKISEVWPSLRSRTHTSNFYGDDLIQVFKSSSKVTANQLLELLGFYGGIEQAASLDYYFQLEPLVAAPIQTRTNAGTLIFYFVGTTTELIASNHTWATSYYLTHHGSQIYIQQGKRKPTAFTDGTTDVSQDKFLSRYNGLVFGIGVGHLWTGDFTDTLTCDEMASMLNNGVIRRSDLNQATMTYNGVQLTISQTEVAKLQQDATAKYVCKEQQSPCGQPALTGLGSCASGNGVNFYRDRDEEDQWLKCGIAYSQGTTYYSSENTGHAGVGGVAVGNSDYCQIFCHEEFSTSFPTSATPSIVKAGQTFGWGAPNGGRDGVFGTVEVSKHCSVRQGGYKYGDWSRNYVSNEKSLVEAYLKVLAYKELDGQTTTSSATKVKNCPEGTSLNAAQTACESEVAGITAQSACVSPNSWVNGKCFAITTPSETWNGSASKQSNVTKTHTDSFVGTVSSGEISVSGSSSGKNSEAEAKTAAENDLQSNIDTGKNAGGGTYKTSESSLLTAISQCVNNLVYDNGLKIDFTFDEPVNSFYGTLKKLNKSSYQLEADVISGNLQSSNSIGGCSDKTVYTYSLGTSVGATPVTVYDCSTNGITWDLNATIAYKYPADEFTWFTLKTDGTLINQEKKTDVNAKDSYNNSLLALDETYFYYIGYGIPTAITLPDGTYDRLKVEVSNVGDQDLAANRIKANNIETDNTISQSVSTTNHFEPLTQTLSNGKKGFDYTCPYKVENDLFGYDCPDVADPNTPCDKDPTDDDPNGELKGVDVAYRVISLLDTNDQIKKAFPGRDATGRRIGSNWQGSEIEKLITDTDRANGVTTVDDKIHQILKSDVYTNSRAMYDIMLDVPTLTSIRKDTETFASNHSGDNPYTTFSNVTCKSLSNDPNSPGYNVTYCASDFITGLISSGKLKGNCAINLDSGRRAEHILVSGCDASYTPINPNWNR